MEGSVGSGEFSDRAGGGFHNMIHGFKTGRRKGTASLKVKLLHQLTVMMEDILYKVLLYI